MTPNTVLVLRTCAEDMSSSRGFVWPRVANDGWMTYPSGPTRSPGSRQRRARVRARRGGGR